MGYIEGLSSILLPESAFIMVSSSLATLSVRSADAAILRKIARVTRGSQLRVLDLFSGCGGLSLGFQREGYAITANVELDGDAARSHALNFHGASASQLEMHARARDITRLEPHELASELNLGPVQDAIDVVIGGPPCQAYARVGRAKLRHIADDPKAFRFDARRNLYQRYLHYVEQFQPLALVMENVPDILNQDGQNIVQEMAATLGGLGYDVKYSLLNAASYGVPQFRDRVFVIAFRRELRANIRFPDATHQLTLSPGYVSSRGHALKVVLGSGCKLYVPPSVGTFQLLPAVGAQEALADLPLLPSYSVSRASQRMGNDSFRSYRTDPHSDYAIRMRKWPGFETPDGVTDHVIRRLPRDGRIFSKMHEGAEYPAAHAVAMTLFEQEAESLRYPKGSADYELLKSALVPPYDPGKFPNKWWKLKRQAPVRTLMAHLGKDCYSHIHYDNEQARTISVREAARLQSFPDGWRFAGTMNPAFRQIGNAVPPLMAAAVALTIRKTLDAAAAKRQTRTRSSILAA